MTELYKTAHGWASWMLLHQLIKCLIDKGLITSEDFQSMKRDSLEGIRTFLLNTAPDEEILRLGLEIGALFEDSEVEPTAQAGL